MDDTIKAFNFIRAENNFVQRQAEKLIALAKGCKDPDLRIQLIEMADAWLSRAGLGPELTDDPPDLSDSLN